MAIDLKFQLQSASGGAGRTFAIAAAAYAVFWKWRMTMLERATRNGHSAVPRWLSLLTARFNVMMSNLSGVRVASESGEGLDMIDKSRRYMLTWHPHGFIVFCPIGLLARKAIEGDPVGTNWHCTGAPIVFKLPVTGEVLFLLDGRTVDRGSLESVLNAGGTVAIQPGGMLEQGNTTHDQEKAYFPAKLGFIRMAIQYGTPLLVLYIFGENQCFKRLKSTQWFTDALYKATGVMLPLWLGKFNLPQTIMPRATDIHCRWGRPVEVGEADPNPSDEKVEEVFQRYLVELQRVFYENAADCLPPDVAARGLKVMRMDGKAVPEVPPELLAKAQSAGGQSSSSPALQSRL
eukprot:TRINITY_DN12578_c0_g1_i1.p1 TRINITY_DN12578_c0_g1~~TRINITY_DN12578_c0_g1_i1.p1  ORF type:complete len:347 (+),score=53.69 TRINITY_DN12578_c0_g1_i1:94-1134(+)